MAITLLKITPVQYESALTWIQDCTGKRPSHRTPNQVWRMIESQYSEGWAGFLADLGDDNWAPTPVPCVWCDTPTVRWDFGNPDCGCF